MALKRGQPAEAIENLREALRQRSLGWDIDSLEDCLANAYLELGRFDEAIAEYERILTVNPHYPLIHYYLAVTYDKKGEHERARAEYERFLELWNGADQDLPEVIEAKRRTD